MPCSRAEVEVKPISEKEGLCIPEHNYVKHKQNTGTLDQMFINCSTRFSLTIIIRKLHFVQVAKDIETDHHSSVVGICTV
jgi:hypothetical protein